MNLCNLKLEKGNALGSILSYLHSVKLPKTMTVVKGGKKYDLTPQQYIQLYYLSYKKYIIRTIYYCVSGDLNTLCTGEITFLSDTYELRTKSSGIFYVRGESDGKITDVFKKFCLAYMKRIKGCKTSVSTLFVKVCDYDDGDPYCHSNIIISYYDVNAKALFLSVYEPHGVNPLNEEDSLPHYKKVDNLVSDITNVLNLSGIVKASIVPRTIVSCPIGSQAYTEDEMGYCLMFSYFWFYCILSRIVNREPQNKIMRLENELITTLSPSQLMTIVTKFAVLITNESIRLAPKFKLDHEEILSEVTERAKQHVIGKKYKSPRTARKIAPVKSVDKKRDGEECKEDSDCFSYICEQNKCVSMDDSEEIPEVSPTSLKKRKMRFR